MGDAYGEGGRGYLDLSNELEVEFNLLAVVEKA